MSTAAMQPLPQHTQGPTSSNPYTSASAVPQYSTSSAQSRDPYYSSQLPQSTGAGQNSRRHGRHHVHGASTSSPITPQQYTSAQGSNPSTHDAPYPSQQSSTYTSQYSSSSSAAHNRSRSHAVDQYDGAPVPPPRTSSQAQSGTTQTATSSTGGSGSRGAPSKQSRNNMEDRKYGDQDQTYAGEGNGQTKTAPAVTSAPAPLVREHSEVISRMIVSDPQDDVDRMQERVAEARPAPIDSDVTPVTGLGLVGSEGVDDGGRGAARRQDYSKSGSRRRDVQFGDYMLGQTLGEGEFGKVKLGWKRDGSAQVAIKLIRRESVATNPSRLPKIYREISILRDLAHPNIVRLHEMVETERHIGIILEYASGGELFDYILNHRYLKDQAARRLFAQLVSGVGYLHKKGIVHRDLKLENLLLDQNRNIIITDFGFANTFNPADELSEEIEYNLGNRDFVRKYRLDRQDEKGMRKGDLMQTSCGSPCYAAPELVVSDSLYTGRKVDVWSCGVILYAMLAGYLPFDDDPANPEGDNINLLYKYITTTPLTFPEYVTPHARDLLRRILVPDPRKRADLFEVARHSWLSEYHHVVSHITSSTTNIADIQNATIPPEDQQEVPFINRSASVREPTKPNTGSPLGALNHQQANLQVDNTTSSRNQRDKATRHTLQPEYVAPQSHTARIDGSVAGPTSAEAVGGATASQKQTTSTTQQSSRSKPLPQEPQGGAAKSSNYSLNKQSTQPQIPRSTPDATAAFAAPPTTQPPSTYHQVTRPSTGASFTSANGPNGTKSDIRLPSSGSYGQPVAPTVAATNAQGRVTQPKNNRGYSISQPIPQPGAQNSIGQAIALQQTATSYNTTPAAPPPPPPNKPHHRRSSTLSGLGERLFGRSGSIMKRPDTDSPRQRNGRKYPPSSMRDPYPNDDGRRTSVESKRSFSFGLGKKKSVDLESQNEKPPRRLSFLPASMSFKVLGGGNRDQSPEIDTSAPQPGDFPEPPNGGSHSQSATRPNYPSTETRGNYQGNDGQQDRTQTSKRSNFSRAPQNYQQTYQHPTSQAPNDVYAGTGVYSGPPQNQYAADSRTPAEPDYRQANQQYSQYPEGYSSYEQARPSMQQGRQGKPALLQKPRKFVDSYNEEHGPTHHEGTSGPAKRVMDFFRRRGRARVDDYRP